MKIVKESASLVGVYTITEAHLETPEQFAFERKIAKLQRENREENASLIMSMARELNAMCRTTKHVLSNIITDRKSTRLNSSHTDISRMPSSA